MVYENKVKLLVIITMEYAITPRWKKCYGRFGKLLSCFKFNFPPATKSRLLVISVQFGAGNEVFVTFVCVCMRVDIVAH